MFNSMNDIIAGLTVIWFMTYVSQKETDSSQSFMRGSIEERSKYIVVLNMYHNKMM